MGTTMASATTSTSVPFSSVTLTPTVLIHSAHSNASASQATATVPSQPLTSSVAILTSALSKPPSAQFMVSASMRSVRTAASVTLVSRVLTVPTSRNAPLPSRHATPTPSVLSKRAASTASATVDTLAPVSSVLISTSALLKVLPLAVPMPVAPTLTVLILVPVTSVSRVTPCPASVAPTSTNVTLSSAWSTHCAPTLWALSNASATKATKWRMACALISTSATLSTVVPTLNASTTQALSPVYAKRVTTAPTP